MNFDVKFGNFSMPKFGQKTHNAPSTMVGQQSSTPSLFSNPMDVMTYSNKEKQTTATETGGSIGQ
ncbi:MAG: hypothetical protein VKJ04_00160 [Vampirovibrionales bacterium]|nr:hypothetical protein [Vampirovibrionales bacterium]